MVTNPENRQCLKNRGLKGERAGWWPGFASVGAAVYAEGMAVFVQEDGEYVHLAAYEEVA